MFSRSMAKAILAQLPVSSWCTVRKYGEAHSVAQGHIMPFFRRTEHDLS
ncbi:hypothetical protein Krac_9176 [Ktedonobacter racemifer DSM 44963]|uniref:Uncharacterized protein n=1 Tax=Ktedonobacter racemifer DSM 44963 TaxID=485913 RepID=D6TRC6_KTERA|nr:hypothetical protein Krac_9176 [Ktedonobacter racemifer DSM 44963]